MQNGFASIVFVVCRESVEALLVIGILNAWLGRHLNAAAAARGRRFLWLGAASGAALALLLGASILGVVDLLPGTGQEWFQAVAVLAAAALILQLVFWMRRHGADLKRRLEDGARSSGAADNWWGLFAIALLAVAREGSETVVFVYGILAGGGGAGASALAAAVAGFALGGALYWAIQAGGRRLPWRLFFGATEIMLLLLAAALVMAGADALVSLELLPVFGGALWDSSGLLDDGSAVGGLLASLTGYRARPDFTAVMTYGVYWAVAVLVLARGSRRPAALR